MWVLNVAAILELLVPCSGSQICRTGRRQRFQKNQASNCADVYRPDRSATLKPLPDPLPPGVLDGDGFVRCVMGSTGLTRACCPVAVGRGVLKTANIAITAVSRGL